jgi:hypothetical protein
MLLTETKDPEKLVPYLEIGECIATVIGYEKPVEVVWDTADHEIRMGASNLAVVTSYNSSSRWGYSDFQRVEKYHGGWRIRPHGSVDLLTDQLRCHGDKIVIQSNYLSSQNILGTARNHVALVERLMSLEDYGPESLASVSFPPEYLKDFRIPPY